MDELELDPTDTLKKIDKVATRVQRVLNDGGMPSQHDCDVLSSMVLKLDIWIRTGGDLPEQWQPCHQCAPEVAVNGRCVRHNKLLAPNRPPLVTPPRAGS